MLYSQLTPGIKPPESRHHSERVCRGSGSKPCVQVQSSPGSTSPGSPGRTARGCANISQVTTSLQSVSYLEDSAKWDCKDWGLCWALAGPGGSCSGLQPFPKHNWVPDGLKWNEIRDRNKLLIWRTPPWYLIMLVLIILLVQGVYFAK